MTKEFHRTDRIAELMQRELAKLLQLEVKDPRISMVTVSAVKVTRDLSYAKVYVTILADKDQTEETLKALNKAAGFFRSQLAKIMKMRTTPALRFIYDDSIETGNRIASLLNSVSKKDKPSDDDES